MLTRRNFLSWSACAIAGVGTNAGTRTARAQECGLLAVVVARNSPMEQLSRFELKKLYLGANLLAPNGERIVAFHQTFNAPDRVAFDHHVTGMQPEQLARYWIDRRIRGEAGAPRALGSVELLQRVVSRLSHAVGYVRQDQITQDLRALSVDGFLPGDRGYPLAAEPPARKVAGLLPGELDSASDASVGSALVPRLW